MGYTFDSDIASGRIAEAFLNQIEFKTDGTKNMKNKKGFEKISGGRMFTAYMSLRGHYASEGDLINEFLRYYNEYKSGIPNAPVYGFRLRITLDETGERKDYFRMQLPL